MYDYELEQAFVSTYRAARAERRWLVDILGVMFAEGWITDILSKVKAGKEANVYCCAAHPATGTDLLAAKVYRPTVFRVMKNDALYREGREMLDDEGHVVSDKRRRRAIRKNTRLGRGTQMASWIEHEYQNLQMLCDVGADVPTPYTQSGNAILMEYVGGPGRPAPVLQRVSLSHTEARRVFRRLLENVELMLACDRVHADLSAFNVLYWQGQVKVIDLPQAVDARFNPSALMLLERDVSKLGAYFRRYGLDVDATLLALDLWQRFQATDRG